jgi:hypothetical protein
MASTNPTKVTSADVQISGILDMRSYNITGLETDLALYPTEPDQGVSKKYVDAQRDKIIAELPGTIDDGVY